MTWVDGRMTSAGPIVKGRMRMTWALVGGNGDNTGPLSHRIMKDRRLFRSLLLLPLVGRFPTLIGDDQEFVSPLLG